MPNGIVIFSHCESDIIFALKNSRSEYNLKEVQISLRSDITRRKGFDRVRFYARSRLNDRCVATVPVSPLLAKNISPNCFLNAHTLSGSNPFTEQYKKATNIQKYVGCF